MIFIETVWKWLIGILLALGLLMVVYLIGKHAGRAGMVSAEEHAAALAALKAAGYVEATVGPVDIPDLPKGSRPVAVLTGTALGPEVQAPPIAAGHAPAAGVPPPPARSEGAAGAPEVDAPISGALVSTRLGCEAKCRLVQTGPEVLGLALCRGFLKQGDAVVMDMPMTPADDSKLALAPWVAAAARPRWRLEALGGLVVGRRPGAEAGLAWSLPGRRLGYFVAAEWQPPLGEDPAEWRAHAGIRLILH